MKGKSWLFLAEEDVMGQHGETVLHIYVTLIKCNKIHLKTTNKNTTVITMHHIRKVMRVLLACIIKNQEIACHIKSEHVFPQKNRKRYTVVITAL